MCHCTEIDSEAVPCCRDDELLLPFMRDELRSELLAPPVNEEAELDEDGGPDVVWAEAEVSVVVVGFD